LLNAENPAAVLAEQGHFALVEGKVVSVRESGATIEFRATVDRGFHRYDPEAK
jgi:hypothetical protein